MDRDEPEQLVLLGAVHDAGLQRHEVLQQVNPRNRDDGGDQLELEAGEIDLAHPVGPVFVVGDIHLGDEVLVTGKQHHQQQVARQRDVDQREHGEHRIGLAHDQRMGDDVPAFLRELDEQHAERADHQQVERRHQPAAGEQRLFEQVLRPLQHLRPRPLYLGSTLYIDLFVTHRCETPVTLSGRG